MEWVKKSLWSWQNKTDLGKGTHLYDKMHRTIKHKRFRQKVFVRCNALSSEAVWKSRWTSWAPVPNKPTVSVDVKQHFNQCTEIVK